MIIGLLSRLFLWRPVAALVSLLAPPLPRRRQVVLRLRLAGRLVEALPRLPPFFPVRGTTVAEVVSLLDAAARQPRIAGLRLDIGRLDAGMARVQEIRRALGAFRATGKVVWVNLESGGLREYMVACAADHVTIPPAANLDLVGLRGEVTYLGGLASALGIHADFEAVGDYKSFAERFVRTGASRAARDNAESLIDDVWGQLIGAMAHGRGLDEQRAEELLGRGPYGADEAVELGLVDDLAYPDEVHRKLREVIGKHRTVKASSFWLRTKRLQRFRWRANRSPLVAVVHATGQVLASSPQGAQSNAITVRGMSRMLNAVRKDPAIEAVVLRIDSPGGSAEASDRIWRELRRLEGTKPVVASMGDVAASGGYYIAVGATQVLAQPGTLTGSIGVGAGKLNLGGLYDMLGIEREVISVGEHSGFYASDRDFGDAERRRLRERMADFYRIFVARIAECRDSDPGEIEPHAQGRVWTGRQALQRGLVDGLGGYRDAVALASTLAGHETPLTAVSVLPPGPPLWSPLRWLTALRSQLDVGLPDWPGFGVGELVARLPFDLRIR